MCTTAIDFDEWEILMKQFCYLDTILLFHLLHISVQWTGVILDWQVPMAFLHDQQWELNPRPSDPETITLSAQPCAQTGRRDAWNDCWEWPAKHCCWYNHLYLWTFHYNLPSSGLQTLYLVFTSQLVQPNTSYWLSSDFPANWKYMHSVYSVVVAREWTHPIHMYICIAVDVQQWTAQGGVCNHVEEDHSVGSLHSTHTSSTVSFSSK